MCFDKPRKPIKHKPDLTWQQTIAKWHLANPEPWVCYLNISDMCIRDLDRDILTLDHVIAKSKGKKFKYDYLNLKAACIFCNGLKGSRTLKNLAREFPHLLDSGIL